MAKKKNPSVIGIIIFLIGLAVFYYGATQPLFGNGFVYMLWGGIIIAIGIWILKNILLKWIWH